MRFPVVRLILPMLLLAAWPAIARGDRLVLADGRTLDGEIHEEDHQAITVEIRINGSILRQRILKSQITTWYKRPTEGVPYVTLPINGVIGEGITPAALRAGFGEARASGAKVVILAINSPGGSVAAMTEMVDDILAESRRTQVIAYVKQAYSAAAVIAMACRQVYMTPEGSIGAVVPFRMTDNGPVEVDAKFRSAFQAKIRATAAMAEHADLIIRGMSELDLEIFLENEDDKPVLRTIGNGRRIKSRGQILSLTAREAEECGLSKVAGQMSDLGTMVVGGPWHEVNRRAWNAVVDSVTASRQREQAEQLRNQRLTERSAAIKRVKPQFDALTTQLTKANARFLAGKLELDNIDAQYKADTDRVQQIYELQMAEAQNRSNSAAINQATYSRDSRLAALKKKYDNSISAPRSQTTAAALEVVTLEARLKQLLASVPEE